VTSVGADRSVDVDVRFIATTNKDLQVEVEHGTFRRDPVLYRLSVMPVRVPPLRRASGGTSPLLARHFRGAGGPRRIKRTVARHLAREPRGP